MNNSLMERVFDLALWLAGAGHFVILIASSQVPHRLQWKKNLASLMPFNRKLLWVQSGFTVLTSLPSELSPWRYIRKCFAAIAPPSE